jgi:putative ABC transport system permease protein
LIYLWVSHELGYDSFHPHADRLYRITTTRVAGETVSYAGCSPSVIPVLLEKYPDVEAGFRCAGRRPAAVRYGERSFREDGIAHADGAMLSVFHVPVIAGDVSTALDRPYTAVITEEIADKYFGDEDPIGKSLQIDSMSYEVTGVVRDFRTDTHLKPRIIGSWGSIENNEHMRALAWDGAMFPAYIRLRTDADPDVFEDAFKGMIREYAGDRLQERGWTITLAIQPVEDIHLNSNLLWEPDAPGNATYVWILGAIGLLILAVACINFINLATARSAGRACEIGMRKVVGAGRGQLIRQFLGESALLSLVAVLLAVVLADLILPSFNELVGTRFTLADLLSGQSLLALASLILVTTIGAGLYPAFLLSRLRPVAVFKGESKTGVAGGLVRKVLVVGQFTVAILFIAGILIVQQQLAFMRNTSLGFDREQKLVLEFPTDEVTRDGYQGIKEAFSSIPAVQGATFSSSVPGRWMYNWRQWPTGEQATNTLVLNVFQADEKFFDEYGLEIVAGEGFASGTVSHGYILNEAAVRAFGWTSSEEALTKTLGSRGTSIRAVMKDFHFRGLQSAIEPLGIFNIVEDFRYLTLRVNTDNLDQTIVHAGVKFKEFFPDAPFDYFFLDEDFDKQYRSEQHLAKIFSGFTALAVAIACLGLIGLAAYMAEQRTKEVGIRKVLGASVPDIIRLLTSEFLLLIALAGVLAAPIGYIAARKWLDSFAYRVGVDWIIFVVATLAALTLAIGVVSSLALRAARANPADALRYE